MSFQDLGLAESILRSVLAEGYEHPSPIQAQAIPPAMEGRDVLGCAQTGTGKTAAFALPILHRLIQNGNPSKGQGRRTRVLVIAPTRELACQICDSFLTYGKHTPLRVIAVYGGVNQTMQVRALRNGIDVLIATPGRLVDLMGQGYVDLRSVQALVLDEADRMFDMGFAPDLNKIFAQLPQERQTLLFSATMPGPIENLARSILKNPVRVEIVPVKTTTELIEQSVIHLPKTMKSSVLAAYLKSNHLTRAIVFTKTKHGADRVARALNKSGFSTEAIHGDKRQNIRQKILSEFRGEKIKVLVATDIAARGIDVDGISHVVNYDLPMEPETYVHRIGRTGRAGQKGIAISFCAPEERRLLRAIEQINQARIPVGDLGIKEMIAQAGGQEAFENATIDDRLEDRPRRVPPHRSGPGDRGSFGNRGSFGDRPSFGNRDSRGPSRFGKGPEKFGKKPRRAPEPLPEFGGSRGGHVPVTPSEPIAGGAAPAAKPFREPRGERPPRNDQAPRSSGPRPPMGERAPRKRFDSSVEPSRKETVPEDILLAKTFRGARVEFVGEDRPRDFRESRLPGKGGTRGPKRNKRNG